MAEFRATEAQSAAIETRGSAVLVSAGAGSGKTRVLTQRLMGYVCDPTESADIDSFLVITFTRAAAAELRGRISEALSKAAAAQPDNRRLRRQINLCRRAEIGTIHGFCAALLRENCHLAGISPDFKIIEDSRAAAMRASALERVLERRYANIENDPAFALLVDSVGAGRDDKVLVELTQELYDKMQSYARPELWARGVVDKLRAPAADVGDTPWGRELLNSALEIAEYWAAEFDRLMEEMRAYEKIAAAYMDSFAQTGEDLRELCRCLRIGWDKTRAALPVGFPDLKSLRNSPDPVFSDRLKARRKKCGEDMEKLESIFRSDSERQLATMAATAPAMEALLDLALELEREFAKAKRRSGLVDYADLEHLSARLLIDEDGAPTELAEQVSRRYTEIMVDEYQDVSRVQELIFNAISQNGKKLFMVGDVKQSVYRFRLAEPHIFTEKYESYADYRAADPGETRKIVLRENFRSRREVLEAANAVFSLCMSKALGDIDYGEDEKLVCGAEYEGGGTVPELLLTTVEKGDESPSAAAAEAAMTAQKIRELVSSGTMITDNGRQRPVEYGDIAILMRSKTNAAVFRKELSLAGIPVEAGQTGGFFGSAEVSALMSMLTVIDNPHQDIPLIAVLRSPAFNFTPDELGAIRAADKKADLYTALCLRAEEDERCRDFLSLLNELRGQAPDTPVSRLIWQVTDRLDLLALCSAMSDGALRRTRLMYLCQLAGSFESDGYRGLHSFVLWFKRLAQKGDEPNLSAGGGSAVSIMTIHKSKGLEFPVVFLCDYSRRFNVRDTTKAVLIHPELGCGSKVMDARLGAKYPSLAHNAIKRRLTRETYSEELRIMYVALTRAKERLYITAAMKEPEKKLSDLSAKLTVPMPTKLLSDVQTPFDWLLYAHLASPEKLACSILGAAEKEEAEETGAELSPADPAAAAEIRRRLSFVYPHSRAESLPSKITATELKGSAEPDEDAHSIAPREHRPFALPDFARRDRPPTGAERGTATHLVLQYMDFSQGGDIAAVEREIERLRAARFISDRDAAAVDAGAVAGLFNSPLGKRLLSAKELRREFKFSLLCPAGEIYPDAQGEELLLQGVVDCYFAEPDGLVIVDYKTDQVKTERQLKERAAFYSGQVSTYARALERIEGRPVKECVLYFLSAGKAVSIDAKKHLQ